MKKKFLPPKNIEASNCYQKYKFLTSPCHNSFDHPSSQTKLFTFTQQRKKLNSFPKKLDQKFLLALSSNQKKSPPTPNQKKKKISQTSLPYNFSPPLIFFFPPLQFVS